MINYDKSCIIFFKSHCTQDFQLLFPHSQPGNMKSKSYTRLEMFNKSFSPPKKKEVRFESKIKSSSHSTPTITEIYTNHGSFRILEGGVETGKKPALVTKKGVAVPHQNYWLQKPERQTILGEI